MLNSRSHVHPDIITTILATVAFRLVTSMGRPITHIPILGLAFSTVVAGRGSGTATLMVVAQFITGGRLKLFQLLTEARPAWVSPMEFMASTDSRAYSGGNAQAAYPDLRLTS